MSVIRFRLAKPCDAKQIANCHWHVRDRYTQGIFLSLGEGFLRVYYSIILNDPWEVVVCAEREDGKIVGFSSATIDGRVQADNLRKHRIRLGFAALKSIILHPGLLKEIWLRYKSLKVNNDGPNFLTVDGVRGEYWCWNKDDDSLKSIEMDNIKSYILYDLGCRECFFEVDKNNKQVFKYHLKVNKAEPIEEITLPDGRERVLFKKTLRPNK
jgi:hypothetical protein